MKRISLFLVISFVASLVGSSAVSDWMLVKTTATAKHYINTKRVILSDAGYVLAWTKRLHRRDTPEGRADRQQWVKVFAAFVGKANARDLAYTTELNEFDCHGRRERTIRYIAYDSFDKVIRVASLEDPELEPGDELGVWREIAEPTSISGRLMNAACTAAQNTNSDSSSSFSSSMSEDDRHKLFQAAGMTNDKVLVQRVLRKLGLITASGEIGSTYEQFLRDHLAWASRNSEFVRSVMSAESAHRYVKDHIN